MDDASIESFRNLISFMRKYKTNEDEMRKTWDMVCNEVNDCERCGICDET